MFYLFLYSVSSNSNESKEPNRIQRDFTGKSFC